MVLDEMVEEEFKHKKFHDPCDKDSLKREMNEYKEQIAAENKFTYQRW